MNKKTIISILVLLTVSAQVLLISYGCGSRKHGMLKEQLKGDWKIIQLGEFPIQTEADSDQMTFSFDFQRSKAGGRGFCNSYGTNFVLSNKGECDFEAVFSTRVGCDGNQLESLLGLNIEKSKKILPRGDKLFFYDNRKAEGDPIIIMERKANSAQK